MQLLVSPGAKMNFINNIAYIGGAIYAFSLPVVFENYIWNRLCIIQYNDPELEDVPIENWQVRSLPAQASCLYSVVHPDYSSLSYPLYVECEYCL